VGEQLVGEEHRLGVLQVGHAGGRDVPVPLGEADQRVLQGRQLADQGADVVAQVQPQVGGDLVVAAAAGAQLAAQRAQLLRQPALERLVDVLVGLDRTEGARRHLGGELGQRAEHPRQLVVGQQSGPVQDTGVRPRAGQVERGQLPVEVGRLAQRGHRRRGAAAEAAAPQPGVRGCRGHGSALSQV
jgi:hypothetical protein